MQFHFINMKKICKIIFLYKLTNYKVLSKKFTQFKYILYKNLLKCIEKPHTCTLYAQWNHLHCVSIKIL